MKNKQTIKQKPTGSYDSLEYYNPNGIGTQSFFQNNHSPEEKKAIKAAKSIFSQDDEIDHLNSQVQTDLIKRMSRDSKLVEQGTYIIWVAHNLERISDRANNIAERTIYVITGDSGAILPYELEE